MCCRPRGCSWRMEIWPISPCLPVPPPCPTSLPDFLHRSKTAHSPYLFDPYLMLYILFLYQVRTLRSWFTIKAVVFLRTVMRWSVFSLSLPSWALGFFHISWVGLKLFTRFMALEKCFCFLGFHSWKLWTLHFPHFLWDANNKHVPSSLSSR